MKKCLIKVLRFILRPLIRECQVSFTLTRLTDGGVSMRWLFNKHLLGSRKYDMWHFEQWAKALPGKRLSFTCDFTHVPTLIGRLAWIFQEEDGVW